MKYLLSLDPQPTATIPTRSLRIKTHVWRRTYLRAQLKPRAQSLKLPFYLKSESSPHLLKLLSAPRMGTLPYRSLIVSNKSSSPSYKFSIQAPRANVPSLWYLLSIFNILQKFTQFLHLMCWNLKILTSSTFQFDSTSNKLITQRPLRLQSPSALVAISRLVNL